MTKFPSYLESLPSIYLMAPNIVCDEYGEIMSNNSLSNSKSTPQILCSSRFEIILCDLQKFPTTYFKIAPSCKKILRIVPKEVHLVCLSHTCVAKSTNACSFVIKDNSSTAILTSLN